MAKITDASTDKHLGGMVKRSEIHLKEYKGIFIAHNFWKQIAWILDRITCCMWPAPDFMHAIKC